MTELSLLVIAAQQGDKDAFGQIVNRFQDMAYASAYALVGDPGLAQDIAQEAFLDAYLHLAKLRDPAPTVSTPVYPIRPKRWMNAKACKVQSERCRLSKGLPSRSSMSKATRNRRLPLSWRYQSRRSKNGSLMRATI